MKYPLCLGVPLQLQVIVTLIVSQAISGGSFAGLGAMLLAVPGIPLTQIINFAQKYSNLQAGLLAHFSRAFLLALILPALQIGLLIAVSVFCL